MTSRELLDLRADLQHGKLWPFLLEQFLGPSARLDLAEQAADTDVVDLATQHLREKTLAKVAVYKELVSLVPARLDRLIEEAQEFEKQANIK